MKKAESEAEEFIKVSNSRRLVRCVNGGEICMGFMTLRYILSVKLESSVEKT